MGDGHSGPTTGGGDTGAVASTRQRILDAATELLGEGGVRGITTRAVSERAGVNNALVHYHFGTKGALLVEAVMAGMAEWTAEPQRRLAGASSVAEASGALVRWLAGIDADDPGARALVELSAEALRDPAMLPALGAALDGFRAGLIPGLAELAPGVPDEDIAGLAMVLAALLDGFALHRMLQPGLAIEPAADALTRWLRPPDAHDPEERR